MDKLREAVRNIVLNDTFRGVPWNSVRELLDSKIPYMSTSPDWECIINILADEEKIGVKPQNPPANTVTDIGGLKITQLLSEKQRRLGLRSTRFISGLPWDSDIDD